MLKYTLCLIYVSHMLYHTVCIFGVKKNRHPFHNENGCHFTLWSYDVFLRLLLKRVVSRDAYQRFTLRLTLLGEI